MKPRDYMPKLITLLILSGATIIAIPNVKFAFKSNHTPIKSQEVIKPNVNQKKSYLEQPKIDPTAAQKLLEKVHESRTDTHEKIILSSEILADLCKSGYTEEAWNLIEKNPGILRSGQISYFFTNSKITSEQALKWMKKLQDAREMASAAGGYFSSFTLEELKVFTTSDHFIQMSKMANESYPDVSKTLLASTLSNLIWREKADSSESPQITSSAADFYARGLLSDSGYSGVLDSIPSLGAFEKFHILTDAANNHPSGSKSPSYSAETIHSMVGSDAPEALDLISGVQNREGSIALFNGLEKYGSMDPVAANQWYLANQSTLAPEQRDFAAMAFFNLALKAREMDGAKAWMEQIHDPQAKKWATEQFKSSDTGQE